MRVVWVPNGEVRKEYEKRGLIGDVLAGKVGVGGVTEEIGKVEGVGEVGDGWGEVLGSLENFDFGKYGIDVR
jgi:pseudouridine-5'-monophosphatase